MTDSRTSVDEFEVTASPPDSPTRMAGTDHVTLIGSNAEDTIEFYRDLLGMPLVLRQPNLDDPSQTHLFFDTGDGRILTFFVNDDRDSNPQPQRVGVGGVHHVAFRVDPERFEEVKAALNDADHRFSEFDRGIFHSVYTRDHNGLTIELATDKYGIPNDRRGEVLATTQRIREADGADYAKADHLEAALEELGIPVEKHELSTAPSGVDEQS